MTSKARRFTRSSASCPRLQTVTSYPSCRSTAAQLSRRVCSSSTTRIRTRALASGPIASNAAGSCTSPGWTPPCVIGMDIALVLDNGRPHSYARFGPHCRDPAASPGLPHGLGNIGRRPSLATRSDRTKVHPFPASDCTELRHLSNRSAAAHGIGLATLQPPRNAVFRSQTVHHPERYPFHDESSAAGTWFDSTGDGSAITAAPHYRVGRRRHGRRRRLEAGVQRSAAVQVVDLRRNGSWDHGRLRGRALCEAPVWGSGNHLDRRDGEGALGPGSGPRAHPAGPEIGRAHV